MGRTKRNPVARGVLALVGFTLAGAATPLRAEPFRFPWDPPPPPAARPSAIPQERLPAPRRLSAAEVRAILAREGVRPIGAPRFVRGQWVAIGRDGGGDRQKYVIDAIGGDVLEVVYLPPEPRPPVEAPDYGRMGDLAPPDAPLPPPEHARSPREILASPLPPPQGGGAPAAPQAQPSAPPSADAALSPIRPLRPPGGPKVEPLPQ